MRIVMIVIIGIHALIHLMGFVKAFGLAEIDSLNLPISKAAGVLWLFTTILFILSLVLYTYRSDLWWIFSLIAVIASQILIIIYWSDAKFGTIPNLIILLAIFLAFSAYRFKEQINSERASLLAESKNFEENDLSRDDIAHLPPLIQKWLERSGALKKPKVSTVYLTQEVQLKLSPDQSDWMQGKASQYFTVDPPAFIWNIHTHMNPFISFSGRDKFEQGKGEMLIKLLSFFPVANAKENNKIDQASLQRYLAEIVWFPSAAVSQYISWESADSNSVKASLSYNGTTGSGVFYFSEDGTFEKFVCERYQDINDQQPTQWSVYASKTEEINGIRIPTECKAIWHLDSNEWNWLKLKIKRIEYNLKKPI